MQKEKVVIIGGGPAGLTAAIYTARANLSPVVICQSGGQLTETTKVENFPGFPGGIDGPELIFRMTEQAKALGARIISESVSRVMLEPGKHMVSYSGGEIESRALIIATGARAKKLGIKGEEELKGRGVSYCATCDGFFFRKKNVVVIGGGDTTMEEAIYLSGLCQSVTIVHRRDAFRAAPVLVQKARSMPNINFLLERVPVEFVGNEEGLLKSLRLKHTKSGEEEVVNADGAFIAIGHQPASELFKGQIKLDEEGFIITKPGTAETSVEGVFAAGDVQDRIYRQAITAAASGCIAAKNVISYLGEY